MGNRGGGEHKKGWRAKEGRLSPVVNPSPEAAAQTGNDLLTLCTCISRNNIQKGPKPAAGSRGMALSSPTQGFLRLLGQLQASLSFWFLPCASARCVLLSLPCSKGFLRCGKAPRWQLWELGAGGAWLPGTAAPPCFMQGWCVGTAMLLRAFGSQMTWNHQHSELTAPGYPLPKLLIGKKKVRSDENALIPRLGRLRPAPCGAAPA